MRYSPWHAGDTSPCGSARRGEGRLRAVGKWLSQTLCWSYALRDRSVPERKSDNARWLGKQREKNQCGDYAAGWARPANDVGGSGGVAGCARRDEGAQHVVFAIGPADGWSDPARDECARRGGLLSLGPMTLAHSLARLDDGGADPTAHVQFSRATHTTGETRFRGSGFRFQKTRAVPQVRKATSHGSIVSRTHCLAEINAAGQNYISIHSRFSSRGNLWACEPA